MKRWLKLSLLVAAASVGATLVGVVGAAIVGFLLYLVLDPLLAPDTLASFLAFAALAVLVGPPAVIVASALVVRQRALALAALLYLLPFVLAALGFAGFLVGAMGI